MAMMDREGYQQQGDQARQEAERRRSEAAAGQAPGQPAPPTGPTPETPDTADGSGAPPSGVGDEAPDDSFPVPPVPPPPSPGPIFTLAGGGGGGAASFARPGTQAAKPFRSPIFTANRSTAAPSRFGEGSALAGGTFLPEGLAGAEGQGAGGPEDELRRILALMSGGQG